MSTMARYDPDRIAALAAGSLDPPEAAALEAEIAADPRAAAELAAHRLALQALRRAPAPTLSAAERSELRRAVAHALNLEPSSLTTASTARRLPWRALALAAAALAAIVAVVPLMGLLSVGGDEAQTESVALEAGTTTAAADTLSPFSESEPDEGNGDALLGSQDQRGISTLVAPGMIRTSGDPEQAAAELVDDPAPLLAYHAPLPTPPCADEAADLLGPAARGATLLLGDRDTVVWFVSPDQATVERLAILDGATCLVLAQYP